MNAFERMCLFRAEVAEPQEIAWPDGPHDGTRLVQRRTAVADDLHHAAMLLDNAANMAAAAMDEALWRCVEAWRLRWQLAPDPVEDMLAGVERYAPLLALRIHAALRASDPHDRLRGSIEVFQAVFGKEPFHPAPREVKPDALSVQPEPAAPAIRR
jgi:hypothetical protein